MSDPYDAVLMSPTEAEPADPPDPDRTAPEADPDADLATSDADPAGADADTIEPDTVEPDTVEPDTIEPDTIEPDDTADVDDADEGERAVAERAIAEREENFAASALGRLSVLATVVPVAVVVALLRRSKPTGTLIVDQLWTAGFVAAVVFAASRASRTAVLWLVFVSFVFSGLHPWLAAATIGFALMLVIPSVERSPRLASFGHAVVAALAVQSALRFPGLGFTGSASLLAAIAATPVLISGFGSLQPDGRKTLRKLALGVGGVAVIGTLVAALSVLWARGSVEDGVAAAEEGLDFARAADQDEAIDRLLLAEGRFDLLRHRICDVEIMRAIRKWTNKDFNRAFAQSLSFDKWCWV